MNLDIPVLRFLILLFTGLALYAPVFDGQWVFDDERLVSGHDWLWRDATGLGDEIGEWGEVLSAGPRQGDEVRTGFRPIRFFSYRIDVLILNAFGIDSPEHPSAPIPFHVHNLLLHVLCAWMLSSIVGRLFPWSRNGLHLAVALTFLVHPVQTEAVAWVSGRRDVLFSLFYLWVLLGVSGRPLEKMVGPAGWVRGIGGAVLAAMAMATKEMSATLPLVALIFCGFSPENDSTAESPSSRFSLRRALKAHAAWVPLTGVVSFMAWQLLTENNPGSGATRWGGSLWATFWTDARALVEYMKLVIAPVGLTVDYSHAAFVPSSGPFQPVSSLLCFMLLIGITWVCWRKRSSAWSILGWPLFLILLSPVLQWIPHPERFAERFLYLPMLAPMFLLVGFWRLLEREYPGWRQILIPVLLVVLALITRARLRDWEGPYPLWKSAVETEPACARAWFGLAEAAREKGWSFEAIEGLGNTIAILLPVERDALQQGMYLQALQIRAGLLSTLPQPKALEDSRVHWQELLKEFDTDGTPVADQPLPWFEKMKVDLRLSDDDSAIECALRILDLEASLPEQQFEALLILATIGPSAERESRLDQATELSADMGGNAPSRIAYQRGMLLLEAEQPAEALLSFEESERLLEADGRQSSALYRQAECQMKLGKTSIARKLLERVLDGEPDHRPSHLSLGELLLSTGEEEEAQFHFESVLAVAPQNTQALNGLQQIAIRKRLSEGAGDALPDPTRISTLILLAEKLQREGEFSKAREALVEAEKQAEGPAEKERRLDLILRIARLDARLREWARAGESYGRLIDLVEAEGRGAFILEAIEVLRRTGGPEGAFEFLLRQQEEGVTHPALKSQLGALADQAGRVDAAIIWYNRALKDGDPLSPERRKQLEERVLILQSGGDPSQPESRNP